MLLFSWGVGGGFIMVLISIFWCQTIMVVRKSCFATSKVAIKNGNTKWNVLVVVATQWCVVVRPRNTQNNFDWSTFYVCNDCSIEWNKIFNKWFFQLQRRLYNSVSSLLNCDMRLTFHDRFDHAKPHRVAFPSTIMAWIKGDFIC